MSFDTTRLAVWEIVINVLCASCLQWSQRFWAFRSQSSASTWKLPSLSSVRSMAFRRLPSRGCATLSLSWPITPGTHYRVRRLAKRVTGFYEARVRESFDIRGTPLRTSTKNRHILTPPPAHIFWDVIFVWAKQRVQQQQTLYWHAVVCWPVNAVRWRAVARLHGHSTACQYKFSWPCSAAETSKISQMCDRDLLRVLAKWSCW